MKPSELVVVLDFGGQYTQLIARKVRQCKVYCEILRYDTPFEEILARQPKGLIFSGGPSSVYEAGAPACDPRLYDSGIPVLGICYGLQLMAHQLGGKVAPSEKREYGKTELHVLDDSDLFRGLNPRLICWMSHGDQVLESPPGFRVTSETVNCPIASFAHRERKLFGVQFHPEVAHTPWGIEVIRNFLYDQCGCQGLWTMESFVEAATRHIRERVGKDRVLCGLSGGIDSATVAALVHRAVGKQLTCIFVNHGFLRKNEAEDVRRTFTEHFDINLVYIDASKRFLERMRGVTAPEEKRKTIGEEFVRVFEEESRKLGNFRFLAQGTLYPDVIESGTRDAARIKTHHNVGGLPEKINFELLEPLRDLFKDEARAVAEELGLPPEITWRHPFPGPGLAIRIIGEVTEERLHILREADAIVVEEIKKAGLYRDIWQVFAVLPPLRSVGVMGDHRTYAHPIVLRAVTSEDGMTADWARLPYEVLERIANRVVNEVPGVNRLVYDVTSKPPGTIEWE
ncbi:MAG: glutamine-hydrolyzing GMP synthase [Abditibacteriales bacterium]|nr:glutamine-hydrolyzing GMP synthase [Abditibacteriales bacterium]MDW8365274.1 glutamine-hydrolyzing GMP synthase [Abditibacteriales bacterium]